MEPLTAALWLILVQAAGGSRYDAPLWVWAAAAAAALGLALAGLLIGRWFQRRRAERTED